MTNKLKIFYTLIIVLISQLAGCQQTANNSIQTGTWSNDGQVFTNEWANLRVTLPEGYRSLSPEEIQKVVGFGEEIIVNTGGLSKQSYDLSKKRTVYDFIITSEIGLPSFMLLYENIEIQSILSNLDEKGYLNEVKKNLEKIEIVKYISIGTSTKKLAGDDWLVGSFSVKDSNIYQDYYLKKVDKTMIAFIVTYTDKKIADKFIATIKKVK
jgi:hypothetical protein